MIRECLSNDKKQVSATRVMSFIALISAVGISAASLALSTPINDNVVMWFLMAAFGGKVGQKFAERK